MTASDRQVRQTRPPLRRVLLGVCGSSNVLNIADYVFAIRKEFDGVAVRAVMTRTAATLLPPHSLRLICDEVYRDGADELTASHVALANWAEQFMILPCTANMLGQAANGLASGLLSSATLVARDRGGRGA